MQWLKCDVTLDNVLDDLWITMCIYSCILL